MGNACKTVLSFLGLAYLVAFCLFHDVAYLLVFVSSYFFLFDAFTHATWNRIFSPEAVSYYPSISLMAIVVVLTTMRLLDVIRFVTRVNRGDYLVRWALNALLSVALFVLAASALPGLAVSDWLSALPRYWMYFTQVFAILFVGMIIRSRRASAKR